MRHARTATMIAHRGMIVDRFGEPLAVSSPVDSVWVNPPVFADSGDGIAKLAGALKLNRQWLEQRVTSNLDREFLYVARHLDPDKAGEIRKLGIPGVSFEREYKRFYPNGEVTAHLLGFTNLDEEGSGRPRARLRPLARGQGWREARASRTAAGRSSRKSRVLQGAAAGRGAADSASTCASSTWRTAS